MLFGVYILSSRAYSRNLKLSLIATFRAIFFFRKSAHLQSNSLFATKRKVQFRCSLVGLNNKVIFYLT